MLLRSTKAILLFLPAFFLSCSDNSGVVDPSQDSAQQAVSFRSVELSAYIFDTDTISVVAGKDKSPGDNITVIFSVRAHRDSLPHTLVTGAECKVLTEKEGNTIASVVLSAVSPGMLAGVVRMNIRRGDVGDYRVVITGTTDSAKLVVNPVIAKIRVIAVKRPPHFCGITAPDTLTLPTDGFVLLKVQACVSDSSGRADIKRVYFNSFLPNGNASIANPVFLNDNGTNGDPVAGDGIFSVDVQFPSTALVGKYRFEFFVYDLSNLSDFIAHTLLVVN
ncbi:MAG: hypothetical protein IPP94_16430 [Ignavibacteria bacterium]|nr:hypothetical protein [Ignavibacteria bacterium]